MLDNKFESVTRIYKQVKEKGGVEKVIDWQRRKFINRVYALFYARIAFLFIGVGILSIPQWRDMLGIQTVDAYFWYFFIITYTLINYYFVGWKKRGLNITFVTLLFDLVFIAYIISMSGGLKSAVMLAQVLFTIFFALLFPRPLTILPPLLLLPIIASIDRYFMHQDNDFVVALFFFTWYLAINLIVVYMIVYLNHTEDKQQRNILRLQEKLGDKAVLEERTRLAREIHDGLGASLSSLIIQSEYIINLNQDIKLKEELVELKSTAEESIEELRRSLQMMRDQFDLIPALQDYCNTFQVRTKIDIAMEAEGKPWNLAAEVQLCIFRILQESLTNINKHAKANKINITLFFGPSRMILSIRDNGRGFEQNVKMQHHYGLITMGERARKVDGELKIKSIPQEGTTIIFSLEKGSPKWPKLK